MKIYRALDEFKKAYNAVVTLGTFDGVHKGHRVIINRLLEIAESINGEVVVLTFFPHPRMVLYPDDHGLQLLNTIDEKIDLMRQAGIKHLILHPFSKEFSRMSSTEFVRDVLVNKIGVKKLVIGYDHHFGRNREGSFDDLQELAPVYDFEVEKIPEQDVNNMAVSSTKIRTALLKGDVKTAHEFLGYEFSLSGFVIEGNKIGRTLGFPTANINIEENYKLIPANGIYAVTVLYNGKRLKGVISIGNRPTFDNGERSIEVNIFDFNQDIYNQKLTVTFKAFIREEKKFNSKEELIIAMNEDKKRAFEILT